MKPLRLRRSQFVKLVLLGTGLTASLLLPTCNEKQETSEVLNNEQDEGDKICQNQLIPNNTYVLGRGYYHAPYFNWYPYPYNYFVHGLGYYHGGVYTSLPNVSAIKSSNPITKDLSVTYGNSSISNGRTGGGIGWFRFGGSSSSASAHSLGEESFGGTARGGFGEGGHGGGAGE